MRSWGREFTPLLLEESLADVEVLQRPVFPAFYPLAFFAIVFDLPWVLNPKPIFLLNLAQEGLAE